MSAFVVVAGGVLVVMAVTAGSTMFTGSTGFSGSARFAGCSGSTMSAGTSGSTGSVIMSWSMSTPLSHAEFSEGLTSRPRDRRSCVQVFRLKVLGCPVLTDPINPCVISGDCLTYVNSTV